VLICVDAYSGRSEYMLHVSAATGVLMDSALILWSEVVQGVHAVLSKPALHGTVIRMQYRDNNKSESQPSQKKLGTTRIMEEEE